MKAPVVEIFSNIQGEGYNVGVPSTFVRLYGCNLRCQFKGESCDTPYAVFTERNGAKTMSTDDLEEAILNEIEHNNVNNIIFTGGEPTMFQDYITKTINGLGRKHLTYEVETNGTIPLKDDFIDSIDCFNLSLKLKSSNQESKVYDDKRINDEAIKTFPKDKTYFKFVVSDDKDLDEVLALTLKYDFETYLMPEGQTREQVIESSKKIIPMCIKYGFRFSPREHIMIYDMQRGV